MDPQCLDLGGMGKRQRMRNRGGGIMTENPESQPIDMDELREIMDNDDELAKECFDDFIRTSLGMLANIKSAIDANDADSLDQTAHRFKGTLKYLAVFRAADRAYELEMMGKQKDLEKAMGTFNALVEECERAKEFMIQYYEQGMGFEI
jgi:HPt (histidine-containing phosphotransfer) domain-containing protein